MEELVACRACLITDVKLFEMSRNALLEPYEIMMGTQVLGDGFPQHLCGCCAALLQKTMAFRTKCFAAQQVLERALKQEFKLTTASLRTIDRTPHALGLPLTVTSIEVINLIDEVEEINDMTVDFVVFQENLADKCRDPLSVIKEESKPEDVEMCISSNELTVDNDATIEFVSRIGYNEAIHEEANDFESRNEKITESLSDFDNENDHNRDVIDKVNDSDYYESSRDSDMEELDKNDGVKEIILDSFMKVIKLSKQQHIDEIAARKESQSYLSAKYKRDKCYQGFTTERTFKNHMETETHNPDSKPSATRRKRGESWTEEGLRAAIDAVKRNQLTQRAASAKFNIPRRTLCNHLKNGNVAKHLGRKPIFTDRQESDFAARIEKIAKPGVPLTPKLIRKQAFLFCKEYDIKNKFSDSKRTAGVHWLRQFLKRNPSIRNKVTCNESNNRTKHDDDPLIEVKEETKSKRDAKECVINNNSEFGNGKDKDGYILETDDNLFSSLGNEHDRVSKVDKTEKKKYYKNLDIAKIVNNCESCEDLTKVVNYSDGSATRRKRGESWTEEGLRAAIDAVKRNQLSLRAASAKYNIPRRTLSNHLKNGNLTKRFGRKPIFTEKQESDFAAIMKRIAKSGVALTPKFIRKQAFLFCKRHDIKNAFSNSKRTAGTDWLRPFLKRNPLIRKIITDNDSSKSSESCSYDPISEIKQESYPGPDAGVCVLHKNIKVDIENHEISIKLTNENNITEDVLETEKDMNDTTNDLENEDVVSETVETETKKDRDVEMDINEEYFTNEVVNNSKVPVTSTRRKRGESWTEEGLKAAIDAVQKGQLTQRAACTQFSIPRRTLKNHLQSGSVAKRLGRKPIFTESQELDFTARIKSLAKTGETLTPKCIRDQAFLFCELYDIRNNFSNSKRTAGSAWLRTFLKRNPSIR